MQIALRHADIVRAKQAITAARPGLGDDRDGRHARGAASRLHAQDGKELLFKLGGHAPRLPASTVITLHLLVKRQQTSLGERALV